MREKDPRQIQAELAMPFAPEDLEWRLQKVVEARELGIAVPYVTNRAIMSRLDDVVGPENWYNDFKPWHGAAGKEAQLCGISIRYGDGFITKWDGAEDSDIEPVKGGLSDSMKRAAVQWGIGRVLYNMDVVFVDVEKRGKTWYIKKDQQERLDYAYLKMLGKLGLTPAPPGGLRTPADAGKPADGPKPEPEPQTPTAGAPETAGRKKSNRGACIVRSARQNKGMNDTVSTALVLENAEGTRREVFIWGAHPELSVGTVITDVKLEKKQHDTVVYFMLENFKLADIQPQAA